MKTNRTLVGALALVSFFALTAAKGQGCGGTVETAPQPEPAPCAQGYHLQDVCTDDCQYVSSSDSSTSSGSGSGASADCGPQTCEQTCVPDDACPDGTVEQTVCDTPVVSSDSSTATGSGTGCAEGTGCAVPSPSPDNCWTECVPASPCDAGYHEEQQCDPQPLSDPPSGSAGSGDQPTDPNGECYSVCVPDTCPDGTYEQTVCDGGVVSGPQPDCGDADCAVESCWIECMPLPEEPPSAS